VRRNSTQALEDLESEGANAIALRYIGAEYEESSFITTNHGAT
jgi:hypothetical protein